MDPEGLAPYNAKKPPGLPPQNGGSPGGLLCAVCSRLRPSHLTHHPPHLTHPPSQIPSLASFLAKAKPLSHKLPEIFPLPAVPAALRYPAHSPSSRAIPPTAGRRQPAQPPPTYPPPFPPPKPPQPGMPPKPFPHPAYRPTTFTADPAPFRLHH